MDINVLQHQKTVILQEAEAGTPIEEVVNYQYVLDLIDEIQRLTKEG